MCDLVHNTKSLSLTFFIQITILALLWQLCNTESVKQHTVGFQKLLPSLETSGPHNLIVFILGMEIILTAVLFKLLRQYTQALAQSLAHGQSLIHSGSHLMMVIQWQVSWKKIGGVCASVRGPAHEEKIIWVVCKRFRLRLHDQQLLGTTHTLGFALV